MELAEAEGGELRGEAESFELFREPGRGFAIDFTGGAMFAEGGVSLDVVVEELAGHEILTPTRRASEGRY